MLDVFLKFYLTTLNLLVVLMMILLYFGIFLKKIMKMTVIGNLKTFVILNKLYNFKFFCIFRLIIELLIKFFLKSCIILRFIANLLKRI